jgi:hypothetical protein
MAGISTGQNSNRNASPQGAMCTAVPVRSPQRFGVFASKYAAQRREYPCFLSKTIEGFAI